jgi:hypothetical protein
MGNVTCKKPSDCIEVILSSFNYLFTKKNNVNIQRDIELKEIVVDNHLVNLSNNLSDNHLNEDEINRIMEEYDKPSLTNNEIDNIIKHYDTTNVFINSNDLEKLTNNIDIITKIKPYDKIYIDENNNMSIHNTNFMFFSRYMSNNNRFRTIDLITYTINEYIKNKLLKDKYSLVNGLNNLILTYITDKTVVDKIQSLIDIINAEMV